MASSIPTTPHRKALIGTPSNFWLHSSQTGFDLTHPSDPSTPSTSPKVTIPTTTSDITISPAKSALVIIDMQNFFLSAYLGRARSSGHAACDALVQHAVPAARKAGIRVVWLNWGLTDKDMENMPPAVRRAFGFYAIPADAEFDGSADHAEGVSVDKHGETTEGVYRGLGAEMGSIEGEDGEKIEAGRLLMKDTWNAALYPPLDKMYAEGKELEHNPDVLLQKDRMSGMWGAKTDFEEFVEAEGIRTLFFAGVNTDQCVGGTLTDAFSKGYDCILLSDGCGTTSPEAAQECYEYNAGMTYGFCTSCENLAKGVDGMER
jgi:nicotinamidase-related amidase